MPDFRFRLPSIEDLTRPQKIALSEKRSLLVTGRPGSGKTVVSIFRFLKQTGLNLNSIFFTFNRTLMSAIRGTLRQKADILLPNLSEAEVEKVLKNQIGSVHEWYGENFRAMLTEHDDVEISKNFERFIEKRQNKKYSELFIDESQDLRPVIIDKSHVLSKIVSCGADRSQDLQGHYSEPADETIFDILNGYNNTIRQELTQNFRNTREIFEFARGFVPEDTSVQEMDVEDLKEGETPDLRELDQQDQLNLIKEVIEQNPNSNIGILVHFKSQVRTIRDFLIGEGYSCEIDASEKSFSYYYSGMKTVDELRHRRAMETRLQTPFIVCFDSCKGLEFDIVVMPFFEKADWSLSTYRKNEDNEPELDASGNYKYLSTPNHYYVAATRARRQLYVTYTYKPNALDFHNADSKDLFNGTDNLPF